MSSEKDVIEKITIDGEDLEFVTRDRKTYLKKEIELTESKKDDPERIVLPDIIVVTRKNGLILFVLRAPNEGFKFVTAQTLYDRYKYQWFEPLADNYRELIYLNDKEYTKDAYKYFTWKEIDNAASIDRSSISYFQYMPGDWKRKRNGGSDFLLVMIEGVPYWTDAIGQIPFAVDTYRSYRDVKKVVGLGIQFGAGDPIKYLTGSYDTDNLYDNYFVLRGAMYAKRKYSYHVEANLGKSSYPAARIIEMVNLISPSELSKPVTKPERDAYAEWKY